MQIGRMSQERIDEIRRMYLAGEKVEVIALEVETTTQLVAKYTADLPRRSAKAERIRLRSIELAAQGMWIADIAKELGCSIQTVRNALTPPMQKSTAPADS